MPVATGIDFKFIYLSILIIFSCNAVFDSPEICFCSLFWLSIFYPVALQIVITAIVLKKKALCLNCYLLIKRVSLSTMK